MQSGAGVRFFIVSEMAVLEGQFTRRKALLTVEH